MLLCPFLRHVPHCGLITCRLLPLPKLPKTQCQPFYFCCWYGPCLVQAGFLGVLSDYCSPNLNVSLFTTGAGMVPGPSEIFEKRGFSMKHLFHGRWVLKLKVEHNFHVHLQTKPPHCNWVGLWGWWCDITRNRGWQLVRYHVHHTTTHHNTMQHNCHLHHLADHTLTT